MPLRKVEVGAVVVAALFFAAQRPAAAAGVGLGIRPFGAPLPPGEFLHKVGTYAGCHCRCTRRSTAAARVATAAARAATAAAPARV